MVTRCTLCRRPFPDRSVGQWCECGWHMDPNCERNHEPFCTAHGSERWIGAVEF
jgi:hypothetical protein